MKPVTKTVDGLKSSANDWEKAAFDHGKLNGSWFAVAFGTVEYTRWRTYFIDLGWMPYSFRRCEDDRTANYEWTAPCRWPDGLRIGQFDLVAKRREADDGPRKSPSAQDRARVKATVDRYMAGRTRAKREWKPQGPVDPRDSWGSISDAGAAALATSFGLNEAAE